MDDLQLSDYHKHTLDTYLQTISKNIAKRNPLAFLGNPENPKQTGYDEPIYKDPEGRPIITEPLQRHENLMRWFRESKVIDDEGKPRVMYHGTGSGGFSKFRIAGGKFGLFGTGAYFTDNPEVAGEYAKNRGIRNEQTFKKRGVRRSDTVYPVYLSIQNPLDMDDIVDEEKFNQWVKAFPGELGSIGDVGYEMTYGEILDWAVLSNKEKRETQIIDGKHYLLNEDVFSAITDYMEMENYQDWEAEESFYKGLKVLGHDGITHIGGGRVGVPIGINPDRRHRVFIVLDPEQIKSTYNRGTFDPENEDIMSINLMNKKTILDRSWRSRVDRALS